MVTVTVRTRQQEVDGPFYYSAACDAPDCTGFEDAGAKDPDAAGPWFSRTYVKSVSLAERDAGQHIADHHAADLQAGQVLRATSATGPGVDDGLGGVVPVVALVNPVGDDVDIYPPMDAE